MTYRRSNQVCPVTSRWRTKHLAVLAQWLPAPVLESDRALNYVLLHGDDELGSGWSPAWLTIEEAKRFAAFLAANLSVGSRVRASSLAPASH